MHILTRAALAVSLGLGLVAGATAAEYPSRPIQFFVGFPPGGSTDTAARIIAPALAQKLGQPVILDNQAGAGGVIGIDLVSKAKPDGYAMGFGVSGALTANVTLMPSLPYDPRKDITAVSQVVDNPLVLAVNSDLGVNDVQGLIARGKAKPGSLSYGTAGPGTAMNLAGELLNQRTGLGMVHVPYKGSSPAVMDLIANHIQAVVVDLASTKPHIDSGRLKALAVTSAQRTPLAPTIPTMAEAGVPDYAVESWFSVIMPPGVSQPVLDKVHGALVEVLADPKVGEQLMRAGLTPKSSTPQELAQRIDREITLYADLIKAANITR